MSSGFTQHYGRPSSGKATTSSQRHPWPPGHPPLPQAPLPPLWAGVCAPTCLGPAVPAPTRAFTCHLPPVCQVSPCAKPLLPS